MIMNISNNNTWAIEDLNLIKTIQNFKNNYPIELWKKFGFFDESYVEKINVHWLKFDPPDKTNHYILAVLYFLIMITGLGGNFFVIFMFFKRPSLRSPANTLVMNLAISDSLIIMKMPIFIINSMYFGPVLGEIGCEIYGFVGGLAGTTSICTLAAISVDRYYVIKFPLSMRFTSARAKICVTVSWVYSTLFSVVPLLNSKFGSYVPEGYLTSCSFDYLTNSENVKVFIFIFFIAAWFVPFLLITFCYFHILRAVTNTQNLTRKSSESSRHVKQKDKLKKEIKLAGTILLIIVLWFVSWTPYAVVALLGISDRSDLIYPLSSMIPALFCKTAACLDPFIYALSSTKFKTEVSKLFVKKTAQNKRTSFSVFATQASLRDNYVSTRKSSYYIHSCQASEEVQEEMIHVNLNEGEVIIGKATQNDGESTKEAGTNLTSNNGQTPPWWYRPTFSNSTSSVKSVARNWMIKQREEDATCDYCSDSQTKPTKFEASFSVPPEIIMPSTHKDAPTDNNNKNRLN